MDTITKLRDWYYSRSNSAAQTVKNNIQKNISRTTVLKDIRDESVTAAVNGNALQRADRGKSSPIAATAPSGQEKRARSISQYNCSFSVMIGNQSEKESRTNRIKFK